ncbi:MAG: methylmalonyl-CoA epimerase [Vicinamibacterales bacterium]
MKAVLDHVGIAVSDLGAALAFYRDALGLEIEPPEEVASQRVRAHFIPVGETHGAGAKLELLEATAPESPIARYVAKKGPGLHHITLRVDDIATALDQLKARGARLIDEQPRPGAEGALIAFIHPASAHGVLVELKQPSAARRQPRSASLSIERHAMGDLELVALYDGFFALDGGAMFGSVPRTLWSKEAPPDGRNRITLAMRPLLVRGVRTLLIDAGMGDKESDRFSEIYAVDRQRNLDHALAEAGLSVEDIDLVLATHLHFDHAGGFTRWDASGRIRPRFPRARYVVRRGEWHDATHPHERNRASYLADNFVPLLDAGVLELVDDDQTIMPGVRVQKTGGHTAHHQIALLESGGRQAAFVADLMPTTAHAPLPWIMGYDLFPMETLAAKRAFLERAAARQTIVFFEHDPAVVAGVITNDERGRPTVAPIAS